MVTLNRNLLSLLLLLIVATAPSLPAADKLDLDRITPVPAGQPIPIQDFLRASMLLYPRLNPSGTHLAALVTNSDERRVPAVVDLGANKLEYPKVDDDRANMNGVAWLNDQRALTFGYGLSAQDVGKISYGGYPLLRGTDAYLVGIPLKDRLHPIFWIGSGAESGINDIGAVQIDSSLDMGQSLSALGMSLAAQAAEINRRHITKSYPRAPESVGPARYFASQTGELAFAVAGKDGFQKLYRLNNDDWVLCPVDLDAFYFIDAGNEQDQIIVCPRERIGKPMPLQFMNAATGQLGEVLIQDKAYDAVTAKPYRDRVTGQIVGAILGRSGLNTVWFDSNYKAVQKLIESSFPGMLVRIMDNNEAGTLFLIATESDRQPYVYHWVDLAKKSAGLVKQTKPWIDPQRMQPMNMLKIKTHDGRSFDAYVTLPAGASKVNPPPMIVIPPKGEYDRMTWGFDRDAQFFASRGYAVLQPHHRGSTGFAWQGAEEDLYDFLKMSDDVSAATETLVKSGLVDAKRIAIMGDGFGAQLAISGIERKPNLYRCAVANDGYYDWDNYMREGKYFQYSSNSYAYFRRKLGDPDKEKEKYHTISPINFIAQVTATVLVTHDKTDSNVYLAQSRRLVSELEKNKIPHESYFLPDTWVPKDRLEHEIERYSRIEAFLAKHLMPAKPAAP